MRRFSFDGRKLKVKRSQVDIETVRQHWLEAGTNFTDNDGVTPTSRDPYLGELEEAAILRRLPPTGRVLDLGCGDGRHTVRYARAVARVVGVDYVASLLERAQARAVSERVDIDFVEASALALEDRFPRASFDAVISQRCLINLPSWDLQQQALRQVHHVLRPEGLLLLSEGFLEPFDRLNALRQATGLHEIPVSEYNLFFSQPAFEAFVSDLFVIRAAEHYGIYLTLSRVLHPLAVAPNPPRHNGELNRLARVIAEAVGNEPDFARYSYNLFYVLERR